MKLPSFILIIAALAPLHGADRAAQFQRASAPKIPNERIDYPKYLKIALEVEPVRAKRRLTEEQFAAMAAEPGTVVLDARSADKFRLRHIRGAVSLPFTDFTEESLAKVLPQKTTRVLIYCNNNFRSAPLAPELQSRRPALDISVSFAPKAAPASLNISTYVALATYGYTNVYELGPLLDVSTTKLTMEGEEVAATK